MMVKEPLINPESFSCAGKMCQFKAPIAGNSRAIAKIGNAELAHFTKQMLIHELIRGSLTRSNQGEQFRILLQVLQRINIPHSFKQTYAIIQFLGAFERLCEHLV